jgi:tetratricopeptide (TPR) repeat protein
LTRRSGRGSWLLLLVVCAAWLSGCGTSARVERPATVESRADPPPPAPTARGATVPDIAAYRPPAPPPYRRPEPAPAVSALLRRAEAQQRSGELDAAAATLERGLRIAPADAMLWSRLAAVRLAQGRHGAAAQLAEKSNAVAAAADHQLQASNWELIAQAREAGGDPAGARDAARIAAGLRYRR